MAWWRRGGEAESRSETGAKKMPFACVVFENLFKF